jgi:hypothetical protein
MAKHKAQILRHALTLRPIGENLLNKQAAAPRWLKLNAFSRRAFRIALIWADDPPDVVCATFTTRFVKIMPPARAFACPRLGFVEQLSTDHFEEYHAQIQPVACCV